MVRERSLLCGIFFLADDTKLYAICNSCKHKVSHGGATTKAHNTSNLTSHLKSKHPEDLKSMKKRRVG